MSHALSQKNRKGKTMSENTNDVETTSNKEAIVVEKLTMCTRMVDTCIDKALGYIGNRSG